VIAITRYVVVAVAICAWIAVTNHCAFAAVAREIGNTQSECPFHAKPAKHEKQSSQVECCKILRAVIFAKVRDWARDDGKLLDANFSIQTSGALVFPPSRVVAPLLLGTGPPGAFSFAELILQRSLLSHAPPFLA
jgi:hypothetical protein